ncbi:MAG: glutathione S-transferase N-terminal domain-containing protein [Pseudomonadota bacterium]
MKLFGSLTSPFVRAVRIAAIELGIADQIELVETVVKPAAPNHSFGKAVNPIRRVPALQTASGANVIDSRVIIEFLNDHADGNLIASHPDKRLVCLNRHAIAAGGTEALVQAMYEKNIRPAATYWADNYADQLDKAASALDWAETNATEIGLAFDLGAIGFVAMIEYAQFRFADIDWVERRPAVADLLTEWRTRESVTKTLPPSQ